MSAEKYDALTVDDCLRAMWKVCTDDDGPDIGTIQDQWWSVRVTCAHGHARGVSNGPMDLSNAFRRALQRFDDLHATRQP